tara:strand:+ start:1002 stop:1922 length:921 start_codon:yes stop_codon:yes gene_type:complete
MKVNILYQIKDEPFGGGNQFLRALKNELMFYGESYTEDISEADVVLFNSHHEYEKVVQCRQLYPDKTFIHRVDGPMRLYNTMDDQRDLIVNHLSENVADAVVFQSMWSRQANFKLGMKFHKKFNCVIGNACNSSVFRRPDTFNKNQKTSIIATSWSDNIKKGFETYEYLDKNLDFDKYDFYFAGRSPIEFKNINMLGSLTTRQIAQKLRECNIYLTASENDPCSNSLIEALTSGLPCLALNSGGHPEILKEGGVLFDTKEELPEKIDHLSNNLEEYREKISVEPIEQIVDKYVKFFKIVLERRNNG